MHTLTLHLNTAKSDETELNRRFHAAAHLHNVMVKHANRQIVCLRHDHAYMMVLHDYRDLKKKNTLTDREERRLGVLTKRLFELRCEYGLTEYAFQSYLKVSGKQFKKLLTSQQVQVSGKGRLPFFLETGKNCIIRSSWMSIRLGLRVCRTESTLTGIP